MQTAMDPEQMFKKKLTLKILLFLAATDILETLTQLCFKKSVFSAIGLDSPGLAGLGAVLKTAFSSPLLWCGFAAVAVTFIIWSTVLSKIDLSVAVPVASFSYILVPLASIIFLREKISILRWAGICFIIAGVIFVSLSSRERVKTE